MALKQNNPYGTNESNNEMLRRRAERFDEELQADPELAEGQAGGGRIALFAVAIIAILGVVFYGLNNPSIAPVTTAQTTTSPGQTTGSASSTQTSPPPASTPPAASQPNPPANN